MSIVPTIALDQLGAELFSKSLLSVGLIDAWRSKLSIQDVTIGVAILATLIFCALVVITISIPRLVLSYLILIAYLGPSKRSRKIAILAAVHDRGLLTATLVGVVFFCAIDSFLLGLSLYLLLCLVFGARTVQYFRCEFVRRAMRIVPLCSKCGYNLRGSDSEFCPECGVRVERRRN